jgi:hypothetical protein
MMKKIVLEGMAAKNDFPHPISRHQQIINSCLPAQKMALQHLLQRHLHVWRLVY